MFLLIFLLWLLAAVIFIWFRCRSLPVIERRFRLPLAANCTILSLAAANSVWLRMQNTPEVFPDLIGGFPAMSALPKSFEYYSFYTGIATALILFILLTKLYGSFKNESDRNAVYDISLYSLIIPGIMAGQSIISGLFTVTFRISAISAGCGLAVILFKLYRPDLRYREMCTLLAAIFAGLASHLCIELFCNRLSLPDTTVWFYWVIWAAALLAALHKGYWNKFLVISQTGWPLAFGYLLMPVQILKNGEIFDPGFNNRLNIAVIVLILAGFLMLYRAFRMPSGRLQDFIPSLPLAALLCLFCAAPDQWGNLSYDDYHNGELILPWFLFQRFGCDMYVDYIPSRGMVNYVPGFLLWFFKGHDFSFIHRFVKWADLPLYLMTLCVLRRRCGLLAACVASTGITALSPGIGAGLLAGLCVWVYLSHPEWYKHPVMMLALFFVTGLLGTLYSLTDTAVVFTAMLPMAFYMLFQAWKNERKKLLFLCGVIVLFMTALMMIPVCRKIALGLAGLLLLQSDTYTAAHCVPLMKHNITHYTIYYIALNYGFLFLTALFALRLFFRGHGSEEKRNCRYFAAVSLVILGIILIQRAGGRASCELFSRGAVATTLLLVTAVPVWYRDWQGKIKIPIILVFGVLIGACGNQADRLYNLEEKISGVLFEPENTVNPAAAGLPHLGSNTVLQAEHFQHHQQVKNVISSILPDAESDGGFWDLTNNSTIYAYCGNGLYPPMSYPSAFYAASLPLAREMRRQVVQADPVLVLIKGKNIEFYEGTLALRTYPLYTLLMENYRVFGDIYGKVWMIRKGREYLLENSEFVKPGTLDDQNLLSKALDYENIDGYPRAWGASMASLREKLTEVLKFRVHRVDDRHSVLYTASAHRGDFLYLKFNRPVISNWIVFSWQDDFNGQGQPYMAFWGGSREFLVPLSASSNWYLSKKHNRLTIQYEDMSGELLLLEEAVLFDRAE
ncbi:MAG: hypothetical protein IKC94_05150 [Lentisphaeria bacterium]|nr:hypothetical protein [Lentisphaeria bacterium]